MESTKEALRKFDISTLVDAVAEIILLDKSQLTVEWKDISGRDWILCMAKVARESAILYWKKAMWRQSGRI